MKARVVKFTNVDGHIEYTIQQRHFLFRWWWVDAWINSSNPSVITSFPTLSEANKHLCYFDGSKPNKIVI